MLRRTWLRSSFLAVGASAWMPAWAQEAPKSIKIGLAIAKSGPNSTLTDVTLKPNYDMWLKEVNAAGGIMLKQWGKRVPIELVEYDDRSSNEETVRAVERLISEDKVNFLLPPAGTGANTAVAPLFARHGMPQLTTTMGSAKPEELVRRWPGLFILLGDLRNYAEAFVQMLDTARKAGKIGDKVALIYRADAPGVEGATPMREFAQKAGFKLVVDKSYPTDTQDLSPLLNEVKAQQPDTFIGISYPADTVLISDQARVLSLNTKIFFTGVGTQFAFFKAKYGTGAEGQMGFGGIDDSPQMKEYLARFKAAYNKDPENWASPLTYASVQILQQAIERVGNLDRAAVLKELKTGSFDTILGPVRLDKQVINGLSFMIGQWQGGIYQGIAPANKPGAKAPEIPKPAWK